MTVSDNVENDGAESCLPAGNRKKEGVDKLYANLTDGFELPHDAAQFVIMIFHFSQFFDDVADGDEIKREDLDMNIFNCFVGMNSNPFFVTYRMQLLPILDLIIIKWQGSDIAERTGRANEKSFMWRAGFYDLLMSVVSLCHGYKKANSMAVDVMNFYAETIEEYKEEFNNG